MRIIATSEPGRNMNAGGPAMGAGEPRVKDKDLQMRASSTERNQVAEILVYVMIATAY